MKALERRFGTDGAPKIEPVTEGVPRPLFSVMIPVYNPGEDYLDLTLRSALGQDLGEGEMQIEVVDDGSTNGVPARVVKRLSTDRISFFRQDANVGLSRIWNLCIQRARGKLVHILHQDDLVLPGFYRGMRDLFEREPAIGAAVCQYEIIDGEGRRIQLSRLEMKEPGILPNWLERIVVVCEIRCAAIVVKRSVYEELGGFRTGFVSAMDWDMWKRIAVSYPFGYVPGPLASYRFHPSSETSRLIPSGLFLADTFRSIDLSRADLPKSVSKKLSRMAGDLNSIYFIRHFGREFYLRKDYSGAFRQIWESLKSGCSLRVVKEAVHFFAWVIWLKGTGMFKGGNPWGDDRRAAQFPDSNG